MNPLDAKKLPDKARLETATEAYARMEGERRRHELEETKRREFDRLLKDGMIPPGAVIRGPVFNCKRYDQLISDDLCSEKDDPKSPENQRKIEKALATILGRKEGKPTYEPPVRAPRRHKIVRVSMSSMAMLMTCFAFSNTFRFEMDLPQGARMVRWFPDPIGDCLCMIFEHESFDDVPDGEEIPEAAPGSFRAWP